VNFQHSYKYFLTQFDKVILASVEPDKLEVFDSVSNSLRDMKRLQYLIDQSLRTSHMLDINLDVMEEIKHLACRTQEFEGVNKACHYQGFENSLHAIGADHRFLRKNVLSLVARATILSNQLRDTVSFRNSEMNNRIGSLTSQGTTAIVDLSHKSSHEARVVKVLTVVALIFVPTSFAADFMQMGYISVAETDGFSVIASKSLWFYAVLAIPLVIITLAIYLLSELFSQRAARRQKSWATRDIVSKV